MARISTDRKGLGNWEWGMTGGTGYNSGMDENPYAAPQVRCLAVRTIGKLLPLMLPTLLVLIAYAVFKVAWDTPAPVIGR